MADSKISDLTGKTVLDGTEELVIADSGTSKKVGVDEFSTGLPTSIYKNTYDAGSRYFVSHIGSTTTAAPSYNRLYAIPIVINSRITATRIGVNVTTGGSTNSVMRLCLYEVGTDGLPGDLLLDAGTVDTTTTGIKEITISQELYGKYFIGGVVQNATGTSTTMESGANAVGDLGTMYGLSDPSNSSKSTRISITGVSGAVPDPFGTVSYTNSNTLLGPRLWVRVV